MKANKFEVKAGKTVLGFQAPAIDLGLGYEGYDLIEVNGEPSPYCVNMARGIIRGNKDWKQCNVVCAYDIINEGHDWAPAVIAAIAALQK